MTTQQMINQATRFAVYLERLKSGQVQNFNRAFDEIGKAVKSLLVSLDSPSLADVNRVEIEALIRSFEKESARIGAGAIGEHLEQMEGLAGYSQKFLDGMIKDSAVKRLTTRVMDARKVMAGVLREPMKMNGDLLESWLDNMTAQETRRVSLAIRQSWANKETVQQALQKIIGTKKANYKDGILEISRRDAATAIRTSVSHVNASSQIVFMEENNDIVEGFRFVATLDGNTTAVCRSLDNKVYKTTDTSAPRPPMHPNCRSVIVPDLGPEFDFLKEGSTRSSVDGPVSQKQSYYDWLKTQDQAFQDSVLGPQRGTLFRDGGLTAEQFAKLNLGRNFEPMTLEEMRKQAPSAFKKAKL